MKGGQFRKLAEESLRHYGDDPWFFLRELAQNSRDAGARNIWVEVRWSPETEVLLFEDDGGGMTFEAAKAYLYRLYASSKEGDETSAGMFGVGFWSVLRFRPSSIRVESSSRGQSWAVGLDDSLEPRREESQLTHQGTCVVLERPTESDSEEALVADLEGGLQRSCSHLRVKKERGRILPVWFRDRQVSGPLKLDCEMQMPFRQGRVDGVVGLGPEPSVELFVRGLPVWKGSLLEELSSREHRPTWRSDVAVGLAPVIKVNADNLTVVLSRTAVVDDGALAEVRDVTQRAVERLVASYLNRSLGRSWWRSLWTALGHWIRRRALALGVVAGLALLATLLIRQDSLAERPTDQDTGGLAGDSKGAALDTETSARDSGCGLGGDVCPEGLSDEALGSGKDGLKPGLGTEGLGTEGNEGDAGGAGSAAAGGGAGGGGSDGQAAGIVDFTALQARMRYLGTQVEGAEESPAPLLSWTPSTDAYWRILQSRTYDKVRGFVAEMDPSKHVTTNRNSPCPGERMDVTLALPRAIGPAILPMATGYTLLPESVFLDGHSASVSIQKDGTAVVEAGQGKREVRYRLAACGEPFAEAGSKLHGTPAPDAWPEDLGVELAAACPAGPGAVRALLARRFSYDSSAEVAARFSARPSQADWLTFVSTLGKGDCDVLNGLAVLALDRCGYEAHLAMGFVGVGGKMLPGLHAWAEYRPRPSGASTDSSAEPTAPWQVMDLTQRTVAPAGTSPKAILPPTAFNYRPWERQVPEPLASAAGSSTGDTGQSLPVGPSASASVGAVVVNQPTAPMGQASTTGTAAIGEAAATGGSAPAGQTASPGLTAPAGQVTSTVGSIPVSASTVGSASVGRASAGAPNAPARPASPAGPLAPAVSVEPGSDADESLIGGVQTVPDALSDLLPSLRLGVRGWGGVGAASLALLILLGMLVSGAVRRFRGKPQQLLSQGEADAVVAKLALGALVQPSVWGAGSEVFKRPVLLTHAGIRLSLARTIRLAGSGGLYVAGAANPLVQEVTGGRERILVMADGPMAEVVRRIPRALDLDQLDALSKVADVGVAEEAVAVCQWLNGLWGRALGRKALRLLVYASPAQEDVVRDFDLGLLRFRPSSAWKRRVVAINLVTWGAKHRPVGVANSKGAIRFSPERAYDLAQHLTSHSLLLSSRGALLRETTAAALLEAGWGGPQ